MSPHRGTRLVVRESLLVRTGIEGDESTYNLDVTSDL